MAGTVTVYFFEMYAIESDQMVRSKRPATLAAIERVRGEAIKNTAQDVDADDIDEDGFRRRDYTPPE
jgi:hypothetical protein